MSAPLSGSRSSPQAASVSRRNRPPVTKQTCRTRAGPGCVACGSKGIIQSACTGQWNHMGRRQEIKQFILGNSLFTDADSAFTDDTSLIQQVISDSDRKSVV